MQLFSYYLHPFNCLASFIALSCLTTCSIAFHSISLALSCFLAMFYFFSSMSPCFLTCFITLKMLAQPSWDRMCLNTLSILRPTCLSALYHVSMLFSILVLRYVFLCSFPCQVCGSTCLDAMPSACYVFMFLVMPFSCALALRQDVDLDLVVQVYIHIPRPTIKGLDYFLYACVCLLAFMLQIHIYLTRSRLLPCFVPSVGLCLLAFETICLFGCIHPS